MSISNKLQLHLFTVEYEILTPETWNLRNVRDSFWRLYRNNEQGASLTSGLIAYPLAPGALYFVPAGVQFSARTEGRFGQFYVHFDVLGLPAIALRELFDRPVRVPGNPSLESIFQTLSQDAEADKPLSLAMECRVKGAVFEALAHYLDTLSGEQMERYRQRAVELEPVLPAIAYIEENISGKLSNSKLAELCCMNADYFIRRFRDCTGRSPVQYIQEHRIKIAAQHLLFTSRTIEQVAADTGFGNRFYFSRVFARHTGYSPAAFRKAPRL